VSRVIAVGIVVAAFLAGGAARPQTAAPPAQGPLTPEALKAQIDAMKVPKVAWREIAWKSCLLEGLKESRAKNKPALLWVFIDRPADDARC
jgi:hypothetical protein